MSSKSGSFLDQFSKGSLLTVGICFGAIATMFVMKHGNVNKEAITTGKPVASYSPAIKANGNIYISGQIGLDFGTGKLVSDDVSQQTRQALTNLQAIVTDGGSTMNKVVKTTILLADINDYRTVNQVYSEFFSKDKGVTSYPARAAFAVAGLPLGAKVEIEAIALK